MAMTNSTMTNATTPLAPNYPIDTISNLMIHTSGAFYQRYILPAIFVLGLLGNGFTCVSIVARKLYTKSTIFIFIGFISALDFVFLWWNSGPELVEMYFGVNLINDHICRMRIFAVKLASVSSAWILIVCSAVKFYGIAYPLKAMQRDTKRFAVIACLSIIVIAPSIHGPVIAYCRYIPAAFVTMNNTVTLLYECTFFTGSTTTYNLVIAALAAVYVGIPGVLLFGLSIAIVVSFLRSYRRHKRLTRQETTTDADPSSEAKSKAKPDTFSAARNAVLVLVPMSIIHIVITLPVFVIIIQTAYILATLPRDPVPSIMAYYISTHVIDLNHSLNVYVQVSISKFYRQSLFGIDPGKK